MRRERNKSFILPVLAAGVALAAARIASATTYTDALGDNYGGPEVDIANVVVTNDASNITFQVNLNTAASIGPSANHYANYEVGIQENGGAGGQTLINGIYGTAPADGNPYGNAVGISTGENYFIGSFLDGSSYSGGAQLYQFNTVTGWSQVGATAPINEVYSVTPSTGFTFPLSALGLTAGSTLQFDVWTTFGSPQSAYDALDNVGEPGIAPYNSGASYDSATAQGSTLASYTVTSVPEPTSIVSLIGIGGLALRRKRRA
jgi:hypothetical protein